MIMILLHQLLIAAADYITMAARIDAKMDILFQTADVVRKLTDVIL